MRISAAILFVMLMVLLLNFPMFADEEESEGVKADILHLVSKLEIPERVRVLDELTLLTIEELLTITEEEEKTSTGNLGKIVRRGLISKESSPYRGGGAYYSFTRNTNDYNDNPQLTYYYYDDGKGNVKIHFNTGFHGGQRGFVMPFEWDSIKTVTENDLPMEVFVEYDAIRDAERDLHQSRAIPSNYDMKTVKDLCFAVRTAEYDASDIVVAFKVVEADQYSALLEWKLIKKFPVPDRRKR